MDIFYTIAKRNPDKAFMLCQEMGYKPTSIEQMALNLQTISSMGEKEDRNVMNIHPDKEDIIELFAITPKVNCGGGCGGDCTKRIEDIKRAVGSDGKRSMMMKNAQQHASSFFSQNTAIIAITAISFGALVIALAMNNNNNKQ